MIMKFWFLRVLSRSHFFFVRGNKLVGKCTVFLCDFISKTSSKGVLKKKESMENNSLWLSEFQVCAN